MKMKTGEKRGTPRTTPQIVLLAAGCAAALLLAACGGEQPQRDDGALQSPDELLSMLKDKPLTDEFCLLVDLVCGKPENKGAAACKQLTAACATPVPQADAGAAVDLGVATDAGAAEDAPPPLSGGAPDLVVTSISWQPAAPQDGDAVTFSATVKNTGSGPTPAGTIIGVRFSVDGALVTWSDHLKGPLAPGQSATVKANGSPAGSSSWTAAQGTHTLEAWVDDIDRIPNEGDESNNKRTASLTVAKPGTPPPPAKNGALEAPPPLASGNTAVFKDVCPEDAAWPSESQLAGKDVKILLPTNRACHSRGNLGGTNAKPAHNIWLVGGKIDYTGPRTSASGTAALTLKNWTGTVFIEGLEVDMHNTCHDGVRGSTAATNGKQRRVVIQNAYFRGIGYCSPGTHGDLFHAQNQNDTPKDSKIAELKLQNVRGDLINQGLFVPYRPQNSHGVRKLVLERVELRLDAKHKFEQNKISTMIFAGGLGQNGDSPPPDGQVFKEVYLNWWSPWYPSTVTRKNITVPAPSGYDAKGCAVFSSATKSSAKITGTWCKGSPAGGTFVPLNKIGLAYKRSYFTS